MKCVNIFGRTYKIEYADLTDIEADGKCSNKDAVITIHNKLSKRDHDHTLIHEMLHAVFHRISISQGLSAEFEEVIVDSVATFLVDNWDMDFQ